MNLHISELVSKILEPIVDTFEGGCEKISTEDVLASIDSLNEQFKDWSEKSWWKSVEDEEFDVCTECNLEGEFEFVAGNPELCVCTRNREPEKPENPEPEPELEILESVNNELASGSGECFDSSPKVRKNKASPNHIESCPTVTGITEEILESRCEELNLESVSTLRNRTAVEEIRTVENKSISPPCSILKELFVKEKESNLAITPGDDGVALSSAGVDVVGGTHLKTTFENCQNPNPKKPCTSIRYLRAYRRAKWESENNFIPSDENRIFSCKGSLPEDLQNFEVPQTIIAYDVEALYPNLDAKKVAQTIYNAVMMSPLKFESIDYMEGARLIALNWDSRKCSKSELRRILPVRRGRRGARPGLKGAGPRGPNIV